MGTTSKIFNKLTILEAMYKVIAQSAEWCYSSDNNKYSHFIEGVVSMTEVLLEELEESIEEKPEPKSNNDAAAIKTTTYKGDNEPSVTGVWI